MRTRWSKSATQKSYMGPNYQQQATAFEIHNGRSTLAAGTALYSPIRLLPSLYAHGVEAGRPPIHPNAPEPRGRAASGHFLIETERYLVGSREADLFGRRRRPC